MTIRYLPTSDRTPQAWRNGGGITREIAADPADPFRWRLSIAEIAADGPFSAFPGYRRFITLLQGAGMQLRVDDVSYEITEPHEPFAFLGSAPTDCRLLAGPVTVLNVIVVADAGSPRVEIVRPQETVPLGLLGTIAVICLSGSLSLAGHELGPLDAAIVTDDPGVLLKSTTVDSVLLKARLP